jgi:hypothetical protein
MAVTKVQVIWNSTKTMKPVARVAAGHPKGWTPNRVTRVRESSAQFEQR